MNRLHPLGKLLVCVFYIVVVASFNKYDLQGMILMAVFPVFGFVLGELSFKEGVYRMRLILPLVLFVGIFNPFFDREVMFYIGEYGVRKYQVSDVNEELSFTDYHSHRVVACVITV